MLELMIDLCRYDAEEEPERIQAAVVLLAGGDSRRFLSAADWRDVLVAAGLAGADWRDRLAVALGPE
jgi:hypothetical protein